MRRYSREHELTASFRMVAGATHVAGSQAMLLVVHENVGKAAPAFVAKLRFDREKVLVSGLNEVVVVG